MHFWGGAQLDPPWGSVLYETPEASMVNPQTIEITWKMQNMNNVHDTKTIQSVHSIYILHSFHSLYLVRFMQPFKPCW